MIPRAWIALGVVLAIGGAHVSGRVVGYRNGFAASEAAQEESRAHTQKKLFDLGEQVSRKAAELAASQREREFLVIDLEKEALSAPNAGTGGVDAGGLRRLERRWGSP